MSTADADDRRARLGAVVLAAQQAAGILAARDRGDLDDASQLLVSVDDAQEFAGGCLLLAQLTVQSHCEQMGTPVQEYLQQLALDMESAVAR